MGAPSKNSKPVRATLQTVNPAPKAIEITSEGWTGEVTRPREVPSRTLIARHPSAKLATPVFEPEVEHGVAMEIGWAGNLPLRVES